MQLNFTQTAIETSVCKAFALHCKTKMRVLITGATGLVGQKITALCHEKNIAVNFLTTRKKKIKQAFNFRGFYWNPKKFEIDTDCFKEVDAIINLAGASIFKSWTSTYKKELEESRTKSLDLLFESLKKIPHTIKQVVSASAIGIYPHSFQTLYFEDEKTLSNSFLGELVQKWEAATDKFVELGIVVTKLRIGLVFSERGGAFPKLKKASRLKMGASFGTGKQWQSWIHIHDLANMFLFVIQKKLEGVFNAVAPNPVNSENLNKKLAKELNVDQWVKNIPAVFLKLIMGEMSLLLLESQLVSSKKIENEGFKFKYGNIRKAIGNLA